MREEELRLSMEQLRVDHKAQAELVGEHTRQIVSLVDRQKAMKSTIALLQMQVELLLHERDQREHDRYQYGQSATQSAPINTFMRSGSGGVATSAAISTGNEQAAAMTMQPAMAMQPALALKPAPEAQDLATSDPAVSKEDTAMSKELTGDATLKREMSPGAAAAEPERIVCLATLEGHAGAVNSIVALPEGRIVSSARRLMVWHLHTHQRIRTLVGHEEPVYAAATYGTDGLASASRDQTLKLWDTLGGEQLAVLKGHKQAVVDVTSLGMGRLASGSADRTIKIWGITSHRCLQTLEGNKDVVWSVTSLDASTLASGSGDGMLKFWDLRSRNVIGDISAHNDAVNSVAFGSGHCIVSASADATLKLWDMRRRDCLSTLKGHTGEIHNVICLNDRWLASCSADNAIKIWEIAGCRCRATLQEHTGGVMCLTATEGLERVGFSGREDLCFASCSEDRLIKIWGVG